MKLIKTLVAAFALAPLLSNAAVIDIDTTFNLSSNSLISSIVALDDGPVSIANGDQVDLTVTFTNNQALTMSNGNESLYGWLYAADNNSSFSINNTVFEFLGFSSVGGAQSTYNVGPQNSGQAHLGPNLANFLNPGQSITFTGYRVTYDVVSIAQSPHDYGSLWFGARGDDVSFGPAAPAPVPAPSMFFLGFLGLGILSLRRLRNVQ